MRNHKNVWIWMSIALLVCWCYDHMRLVYQKEKLLVHVKDRDFAIFDWMSRFEEQRKEAERWQEIWHSERVQEFRKDNVHLQGDRDRE